MDRYSLLIVDDESTARKKIHRSIQWEKMGINTIYEAENGYAALELIRSHKPDIVILDLRMPGMSGVDMLGIMQKEKLNAKIIVSSGYSDFSAAQKMLESGKVIAYLLKPVIEDYLVEVIAKCIEKIESEGDANRLVEDLRKARQQINRRALKDAIFGRLGIDGNTIEYEHEFAAMGIAVAFCGNNTSAFMEYCSEYRRLHPHAPLKDVFSGDKPQFAVCFFAGHTLDYTKRMKSICRHIAEKSKSIIGIGRICKSTYDLNISYNEALLACECRSFIDRAVIGMEDLDNQHCEDSDNDNRVATIHLLISQSDNEGLANYLDKVVQTEFLRNSRMSGFSAENTANLSMVKAYFARLIDQIFPNHRERLNLTPLFSAQDVSEMLVVLKSTFTQNYDSYQQSPLLRKMIFTSRAKKYIATHYMDKLTLGVVANAVFICPSYLSRLFSEVEGHTFVEYVTEVRANHAKQLLKEGRYKIYEIAEMVGYHNLKHFIRVFKEKCGIPPSQYREKHMFDGTVKEMGTN